MGRLRVLGKKFFSLSLLFNALLTIACIIGILGGFYWYYHNWQPFYPYLVNGNVLWVPIIAAIINIFPCASIGRSLKTGRFLFHHYFYGFIVLASSIVFIAVFRPVFLLTIFFINDTSVAVNVGRFFIVGGLALVLDDLPDVSRRVESGLNWLKGKAYQGGKILSAVQLLSGAVSFYVFIAVCLAVSQNPQWITLANFILVCSIFITSLTAFIFVKGRVWFVLNEESTPDLINGRKS